MKIRDIKDAVAFVEEQMKISQTTGFRDRWMWTVSLMYYSGKQWARAPQNTVTTNSSGVRVLNNILDPSRQDVRVTMNIVEENTAKVDSKITPNEIPFGVIPQEGSNPEDGMIADIAETLARQLIEEKNFLQQLQYTSNRRCILGSHILKACLRTGDDDRDFDLAPVDPWQITLDPSNNHPDIAGCHTWLIHSYVKSNEELKKTYWINLEPQGDYGKLIADAAMYNTVSGNAGVKASESKLPANIVHELYIGDVPGEYSRLFIFARDNSNTPVTLWQGPNPFPGLPFLKIDYRPRCDSPWGKGVPAISINAQDILNLSYTNLVRYMVHAAWVKWTAAKESLTPETKKALQNNAMCQLIEYTDTMGTGVKPEPVRMPELPSTSTQFIETLPTIARRQNGLEDVSFGQTSKRGEPTGAIKAKLEQADTINVRISSSDALNIKRFIWTMVGFHILHRNLDAVVRRIGDRFSDDQIMRFMEMDPNKPNVKIHMVPGALLPKTPDELFREQLMLLQSGMVSPMDARVYMYDKTGVAYSRLDEVTFSLAREENRRMLNNEEVQVWPNDFHDGHLPVHLMAYNNPVSRYRYGADVMEKLDAHIQQHKDAKAVEMMATNPQDGPETATLPEGISPEIQQAMMGSSLGGRSANFLNMAREQGAQLSPV